MATLSRDALDLSRFFSESWTTQPERLILLRTVRSITVRFAGSGSRQDFRFRRAPKLLASSATTIIDRLVLKEEQIRASRGNHSLSPIQESDAHAGTRNCKVRKW